jgi:thiamine-monophosphate kinase
VSPFTSTPSQSIAALGESRLIERIRGWLGSATPKSPAGIGDDCAVLSGSPRLQLITVDPVIYREHFDDAVPPRGVGEKLFKRNLSDIAAMGGRPRAAVVALALDSSVSIAWLGAFYRGLAGVARKYRVPVIGGDLARHQGGVVATLTLIGETVTSRALTRAGAQSGDWLYVTGELGGSLLGHHWRFQPRLAEGAWLAGRSDVRALMDVSDGLAKDIGALTPKGCEALVRPQDVPISRAAHVLAKRSQRPALDHALSDGEDYELLFALNGQTERAKFETDWRRHFKVTLTCLGRFERAARNRPATAAYVRWQDYHGYEHLR